MNENDIVIKLKKYDVLRMFVDDYYIGSVSNINDDMDITLTYNGKFYCYDRYDNGTCMHIWFNRYEVNA